MIPSIRLWQTLTSRALSPFADVGHPAAGHDLEVGQRRAMRLLGPRGDHRQPPGLDHLRVPADRGREQRGAALLAPRRGPRPTPRPRSWSSRRSTAGAGPDPDSSPSGPVTTCCEVGRAGDDREHDVAVAEVGRAVSTIVAPSCGQRLGLRRACGCTPRRRSPASSRRVASARPMRPAPTQPSRLSLSFPSGIQSAPTRSRSSHAIDCKRTGLSLVASSTAPPATRLRFSRHIRAFLSRIRAAPAANDCKLPARMGLPTYGTMAVDWEERVRFDRLREERLARISGLLAESSLGALLCFDMTNIRYITATHIGTWAQDKLNRFCLLPQNDEPIMWDFGSAARHHQLYNPWLGDGRSRAGISTLRGAMSPESGRAEDVADKIAVELEQRGLLGEPVGVDAVEPPVLFALQARASRSSTASS